MRHRLAFGVRCYFYGNRGFLEKAEREYSCRHFRDGLRNRDRLFLPALLILRPTGSSQHGLSLLSERRCGEGAGTPGLGGAFGVWFLSLQGRAGTRMAFRAWCRLFQAALVARNCFIRRANIE